MSDLGPILLVLAAQITLPVLAGLLFSRRDPAAACIPLAAASVAVLLLTPLAFVPRPHWPSAKVTDVVPQEAPIAEATPQAVAATGSGIDLLQLLRLPKPAAAVEKPERFDAWRVVAIAFFGLSSLGVLRFLVSLIATIRVVRGSRPLHDAELRALADELSRQLGGRPVALRESNRVGSAATAGLFRPVVLVSAAWRDWSSAERRAVMAHEIAHVARRDFRSRLIARLAVALHSYHPLVRWLAARLELRQEMAADALAAGSCGGRPAYLKCLAALALRADARPLGFVPTFLSRPRTLLRRIAMLRVTDDTAKHSRRWPALAAVVLLAAAALELHGTKPNAIAGPIIPVRATEAKPRPALDVSYVIPSDNADEVGVFALRVGEVLNKPGMEKMAGMYDSLLPQMLGDKKVLFKLVDVEQVAGRVSLSHNPDQPPPNNSLSMSLTSIRMAKDFDWMKQLQEWGTGWKEHTYGGSKYYSSKMTLLALGFKHQEAWFYMPDARTMVLESEENIKLLIDARKKPRTPEWAVDWRDVEGSTFAIVFPDVKGKLVKKLAIDKFESEKAATVFKSLKALCSKVKRAAVGIDLNEAVSCKVKFACASATDAADVDEGCQALVKLAKLMIDEDKEEKSDPATEICKKLATELISEMMYVKGVDFGKSVDHNVELRMSSKVGVKELFKAFTESGGK